MAKEAPDIIIADNLFCGTTPIFLDTHRPRPSIMVCGITFLWLDRPDGAPAGMGLPPARDASEQERYAEIAAGFDEVFSKPVLDEMVQPARDFLVGDQLWRTAIIACQITDGPDGVQFERVG